MKKLFAFFTVILTLVSTAIAQPSASLFKQVLQLSGQMETMIDQSPESLDQLIMVAKMSNPSITDDVAREKLEKYLKGGFFDDITALALPYYTTLTDDDCKSLVKALGKKELQESMKRITTSAAKSQQQLSATINTSMQQLMSGTTPEAVAYNEAPASLLKKFNEYSDLIGLESTVVASIESIQQQLSAMLPAGMKEQIEKSIKGVSDFMLSNLRPITFNLMSDSVTEQDLQRYIDIYSSPAGQHMVEGNKAMASDVLNFSMSMMQKMSEALK